MTDYLTALAAALDSVTRPEFVIIVGPIAVVAGLFIWAEYRADRIRRAAAPSPGWPTCDAQDGPRRCGRMYGHDGHHVDPFTGTRYHSARWSL